MPKFNLFPTSAKKAAKKPPMSITTPTKKAALEASVNDFF